MRAIKAILFDLDGVVAFTDRFHFQAWKELSDGQGWAFDEEVNQLCRGVSRMASLEVILDHNGQTLDEKKKLALAEQKNNRYRELLHDLTSEDLYPGIIPFLEKLKSEGVRIGLGSASKNAEWILEKLEIRSYFDAVVTGAHTSRPKPDPQVFLLGAEGLGVHPFNCLVFEDAPAGVEAALAAKMKCVGVGTAQDLPNAPATIQSYESIDLEHLLECGLPQQPPCDRWKVIEEAALANRQGYHESMFCLANGRMGLRGSYDSSNPEWATWSKPGFFLNGLFEKEPLGPDWARWDGQQRESSIMLNLCDWRVVDTLVDGRLLSLGGQELQDHRRFMDMRDGLLRGEQRWKLAEEKAVTIRSERLVSMTRLDTAAQRIVWKAEAAMTLELRSEVQHRTFTRQFGMDGSTVRAESSEEGSCWFLGRTGRTEQDYVLGLQHKFSREPLKQRVESGDEKTTFICRFELAAGETLTLEKMAVARGFPDEGDLRAQAAQSLEQAQDLGFAGLAEEEAAFWKQFWAEHDVAISGSERDQQALRLCIYHLRRNHPDCAQRSISATGVTGANYMGWIFWDTELFMLPFFNFTDRELTKSLLRYRVQGLEAARARAAEHGSPGALYPWSTVDGHETNFDTFVGLAQFHINPDIVYALRQYADSHDDWAFLEQEAAALIFETARGMASLGRFLEARGGQFCIHSVCGPDEYNFPVNNNAYTNEMTRFHMETAVLLAERIRGANPEAWATLAGELQLSTEEVEQWQKIAENMFVPFDETRGIHAQDDQYLYKYPDDLSHLPRNYEFKNDMDTLRLLRMQVTKQADVVLLMLLLRERFDAETRRANFDFYEPRTRHASSLSPAVHSVVAADVGRADMAYEYFREAVSMDLDDRKHNTSEGLHFACMGSSWMAAVQGFAGVRQHEGQLRIDPRLPKAWQSLRTCIVFQGNRLELTLDHEQVRLELLSGAGCELQVCGEMRSLSLEEAQVVVKLGNLRS